MNRPANYKTRQRDAILDYIQSLEGAHVTAAQIAEHFEKIAAPIGRATIYRHLDQLTESGRLRKYAADVASGACYQQAEAKENCREHFHLKCEDCGRLLHMECDEFEALQRHILDQHAFEINALKTVFYGKCGACKQEE